MINLLTKHDKDRMHREYRQNLISVVLVALIISSVIGGVLLVPSYLFSRLKVDEAELKLAQLEGSQGAVDQKEIEAAVNALNERVQILQLNIDRIDAHDIFSGVIANKADGITLTGLALVRTGDSNRLLVDGVAAKRSDLRTFTRSLEADELFEDVTFPVSNLTEETDITFNLSLEGAF